MQQLTLATAGFERYAKTTRRATFLAEMEQVVPWRALCRLIEPVYRNAGNGRPPVGLERMLRLYFLQQTKKGNQWYFGMKAHIGIDSGTKPIHAVVATAANVADSEVLPDLLHGEETCVWGDRAYRGQTEFIREHAPGARDLTNRRYRHRGVVDEEERHKNRTKSKVRSRVEHVIGVSKRVFGFAKVRYRGLDKNAHRLFVTCALANLFIVRHRLLRLGRSVPGQIV